MLLGPGGEGGGQAQRWVHADPPPPVAKRSAVRPAAPNPPSPCGPGAGKGLRAPSPPPAPTLGRILPREERCWESWGGG